MLKSIALFLFDKNGIIENILVTWLQSLTTLIDVALKKNNYGLFIFLNTHKSIGIMFVFMA